MNSDTSGGKRADSAPALADGANKRSPRAFVCMNIVSGAPVQNINNAGAGGDEGGGAGGDKGGKTNIWRPQWAHSDGCVINYVLSEKQRRGPAPCCCATTVNFERSAATSGKFSSLATAPVTLSFGGLI